jgi:hypothetical protein
MSAEANLFNNNSFKRKAFGEAKFWPHIYMALFAAGWVFTYESFFRIYLAEILSIIGIVLIPWTKTFKQFPMGRSILGAYVLWIIAILLSDWINATDFLDIIRAISNPLLGALSFVVILAVLSRNPNALISFLVVTFILKLIFGDPVYGDVFFDKDLSIESLREDMNFFKVRIEPFLTPILLVATSLLFRKSLKIAIGALFFAAVLYFYVDFRSLALVFLLTGIFLWLNLNRKYKTKFNSPSIFKSSILVFLIAYSSYVGYTAYTISYNPEGHNAKQLDSTENPYNPFALLAIGRPEWGVIPSAIYERPFFGWGSWAQDKTGEFNSLLQSKQDNNSISRRSIYIPAHSIIGSTVLWSGLLGLISMFWLFSSILKMGARLSNVKSHLLPVVQFLTILIVWHFFFSPPQHIRITFPLALASLIILTRDVNKDNYLKRVLSETTLNKSFPGSPQ